MLYILYTYITRTDFEHIFPNYFESGLFYREEPFIKNVPLVGARKKLYIFKIAEQSLLRGDLSRKNCDQNFISTLYKNYSFVWRFQNCVELYSPFGICHPSFNGPNTKHSRNEHQSECLSSLIENTIVCNLVRDKFVNLIIKYLLECC